MKFTFSQPDSVVHSSLVKLSTQGKASLYLWMLYRHVGDEKFRKGLQLFTSTHKQGLVRAEDLAKAFSVSFVSVLIVFFFVWIFFI